MKASVFVAATTELNDKVELRLDLEKESLTFRILGTRAIPEYVVVTQESMRKVAELLSLLERSNYARTNGRSENDTDAVGEAGEVPRG